MPGSVLLRFNMFIVFRVFPFSVVVWAAGPFVETNRSLLGFYPSDRSLDSKGSNAAFFFDRQRMPTPTKRMIKQSTIPIKDILLDSIGMHMNLFSVLESVFSH